MKKLLLIITIVFISVVSFSQQYTIERSSNAGYFTINSIDYAIGNYDISYDYNIAEPENRVFSLFNIYDNKQIISSRNYDDVVGVSSWDELLILLKSVGALKSNDVSIQDQYTPLIIASFSQEQASTTLSSLLAIDDIDITVASSTGFVIGSYVSIFSVADNRFYLGNVTAINGNILTLDTPIDFEYPIGSFVTGGTKNMNVDGSVTPQIFGVRNTDLQIGSEFDIVRIIIHCETSGSVDLSKFGDIAGGLNNGIVMRKVDGITRNVFNAKTNGGLKNLMFDFDIQEAIGNQQDGFTGRMTFGGQSKMGVVIRLEQGEDLQIIIQDDLSSLELLEIICEGHTVE